MGSHPQQMSITQQSVPQSLLDIINTVRIKMTKSRIWGKESDSSKEENSNSVFLAIKKSVCVYMLICVCVLSGNKGQSFEEPAQHYGIGLVYKNTYKGAKYVKNMKRIRSYAISGICTFCIDVCFVISDNDLATTEIITEKQT